MLDAPARPMVERLSPVRCARCNMPVAHLNKTVAGTEVGGLCTNCTRDEWGVKIKVYTFYGVVASDT